MTVFFCVENQVVDGLVDGFEVKLAEIREEDRMIPASPTVGRVGRVVEESLVEAFVIGLMLESGMGVGVTFVVVETVIGTC